MIRSDMSFPDSLMIDMRPGLEPDIAAEEAREQRAAHFEQDIRDFARAEGWPATLRAVARAMDAQGELLRP